MVKPERIPQLELEKRLNLENVVARWDTDIANDVKCSNPVFKHPKIPMTRKFSYIWLCKRTANSLKDETYYVRWHHRNQRKTRTHYRISQDGVSLIEKQSHHHRDLVDSLWVSEGEWPKFEYEMEVEDVDFNLSMETFENNAHYQTFKESVKNDNNHGNWREKIFKMVVKSRMDYYQERYRITRNDHHLKMSLFWKNLDWKVLKPEHLTVMCMCFMNKLSLGFVDDLLRTHYS